MPYIKEEDKAKFDEIISAIEKVDISSAGEINYLFTKLALHYVGDTIRYAKINDVVGALEGAKIEFYRRIAAIYEDEKIQENGDVY